ncbi:NAD(P)/FAD-dependent oxidoreductase [Pseudonocardia xishanensis]|uniref:NAD(P)/FAD-dependent oxidoreductase n=1 Tax=Pseudonocardia xishanensis TaxID=630995 RepID=A0ABP8RYG1_9PSEU
MPDQPSIDAVETDALVIGAGFAGLDAVYVLRERGLTVRGLEAADGIGGTWYWNRYPGARTDSKAFVYCYTFSKELREEWDWSELYPTQPEVLAYLEFVARRLDLTKHFRFGSTVTGARWDDDTARWTVHSADGSVYRCSYLIAGVGCLSAVNVPRFPELDSYRGTLVHTARWPHEGLDVTGKRVAVIGSGASGIQALPELAKTAAAVTVLQRTPNYVAPAVSPEFTDEDRAAYRRDHDEIQAFLRSSPFSQYLKSAGPSAKAADPEERAEVLARAWTEGGLGMLMATYDDLLVDAESNEVVAEYIRQKIRDTVHDPATAEKLIPTTYPFGIKRPPGGVGYLETFNQPNVSVVDIAATPIERFTEAGLIIDATELEFDVVVLATGFDAATGGILRLNIAGRGGLPLTEVWAEGPSNYLGLAVPEFPNLFTIIGPLSAFGNLPSCIEHNVEFIASAIDHARSIGGPVIEATVEAADEWTTSARGIGEQTLLTLSTGQAASSWIVGSNIDGRKPSTLYYLGGANTYFDLCDAERELGFPGFTFIKAGDRVPAHAHSD